MLRIGFYLNFKNLSDEEMLKILSCNKEMRTFAKNFQKSWKIMVLQF